MTILLRIVTAWMLVGAFAAPGESAVNERIVLHDGESRCVNIISCVDVLEDRTGSLVVEEVASPGMAGDFHPLHGRTVNMGITSAVYWFRFTVAVADADGDGGNDQWLLNVGRPLLSSVRLYAPAGPDAGDGVRFVLEEAGDPRYFITAQKPRPLPLFRLRNLSHDGGTHYLRVASESVFMPLEVCTDEVYLIKSKLRMLIVGLYFGIILALMLYNIFLYLSLRDGSYLWYVLYIMFLAVYFIAIDGLAQEYLLPSMIGSVGRIALVMLGAGLVSIGQFTRRFLMTARYAPFWDRVLWLYTLVAGVLSVAALIGGVRFMNQCFAIIGLMGPVVVLATGLVCLRRGFVPARFFLLAWMFMIVGGLVYALMFLGVAPYSSCTFYSFQCGSALEAVFLSFALADRIKRLQSQREEARRGEIRYRELAVTDSLTGLSNVRLFSSQMDREILRAETLMLPLSVVLLDLDTFKDVNDRYGHQEGDSVIAAVGQTMRASVRASDIPCRYGGEEFAVILPMTGTGVAREVAERVREALGALRFTTRAGEVFGITVTGGVAEYREGEGYEAFIARADKALYKAKDDGRNRIGIAQ